MKLVEELAEFGDRKIDRILKNLSDGLPIITKHTLIDKPEKKRSKCAHCKKSSVRTECRGCPGMADTGLKTMCEKCYYAKHIEI